MILCIVHTWLAVPYNYNRFCNLHISVLSILHVLHVNNGFEYMLAVVRTEYELQIDMNACRPGHNICNVKNC